MEVGVGVEGEGADAVLERSFFVFANSSAAGLFVGSNFNECSKSVMN